MRFLHWNACLSGRRSACQALALLAALASYHDPAAACEREYLQNEIVSNKKWDPTRFLDLATAQESIYKGCKFDFTLTRKEEIENKNYVNSNWKFHVFDTGSSIWVAYFKVGGDAEGTASTAVSGGKVYKFCTGHPAY